MQHAATLRETRITHTHRHQAAAVLPWYMMFTSDSALKMKVRHFGQGWPQTKCVKAPFIPKFDEDIVKVDPTKEHIIPKM